MRILAMNMDTAKRYGFCQINVELVVDKCGKRGYNGTYQLDFVWWENRTVWGERCIMSRIQQKSIFVGERRRAPYYRKKRPPLWLRNVLNVAVRLLILAALIAAIVWLAKSVGGKLFEYKPQSVTDRYLHDQPPVPEEIARAIAVRREKDRIRQAQAEAEANGTAYVPGYAEVPYLFVKDGVKTCYLTFDDGPSSVTDQILDTLKAENIKATFFMLGSNVDARPDTARRVYEEGHSIGNHSYSHDYAKLYTADNCMANFRSEVQQTRDAINAAIGVENPNRLFRFPGGAMSYTKNKQAQKEILVEEGFRHIDWNCLNGDSEKQSPSAEYLMNSIQKTSYNKEDIVVLMHDAPAKKITAQTLPQVIAYLREQGYEFRPITFSE